MARTQDWISDITSAIVGALLLLIGHTMVVQLLLAPSPRVAYAATVALEGLVVTPKRVYTYTQWVLSRPVPVRVAASVPPLLPVQQC